MTASAVASAPAPALDRCVDCSVARVDPIAFIEEVLARPGDRLAVRLLDAERCSCACVPARRRRPAALSRTGLWRDQEERQDDARCLGHADHGLARYGGHFAEGYCVANDQEQAVAASSCGPAHCRGVAVAKREAKLTADRVLSLRSTPPSLPSHATRLLRLVAIRRSPVSTRCGATRRSAQPRLWDEMITCPPVDQLPADDVVCWVHRRKRIARELHSRGMALPGLLRAARWRWHALRVAHRTDRTVADERWLAEMRRSLRPNAYARMIENQFVSAESAFVDLSSLGSVVRPCLTPLCGTRAADLGWPRCEHQA